MKYILIILLTTLSTPIFANNLCEENFLVINGLSKHFEESHIPKILPKILPHDWKGGFLLLCLVFILSSFLDNIAAAIIGGTIAHVVYRGKVHIGFLAAIIAAFWYLRNEELEREQESVKRDTEVVQQQVRLRMIESQEQLLRMAREISLKAVFTLPDALESGVSAQVSRIDRISNQRVDSAPQM